MPSLRITRRTPSTAAPVDTPLAFEGGLSQPVPLPGGDLVVRVRDTDPVGSSWTVTALAPPAVDLDGVAQALAVAGAPAFLALWGDRPEEPFLTWKGLWESGGAAPDRLAGVLLALAARTLMARTHEVS